MVNVNISLTEEAYSYLKMLKGRDKSFSEVVIEMKTKHNGNNNAKRMLSIGKSISDLNIDWDKREKIISEVRNSFNRRLSR